MSENNQRLRGMIGFAMRAGKLLIGTDIICRTMAKNKNSLKLVILASNASSGTQKRLSTKCEFYGLKMVQINISTDELGALLGKTYTPAAIGITDEGFAKEIEKALIGEIN